MSSFPGQVGYASGLLGFLQLGTAGLTSSLIGELSLNQVDRLAEFIFVAVLQKGVESEMSGSCGQAAGRGDFILTGRGDFILIGREDFILIGSRKFYFTCCVVSIDLICLLFK